MERGVFANSNGSQRELITWLNAKKQTPFSRVSPRNETVQVFDPLHQRHRNGNFQIPERIVEIYDVGALGEEGRPGRRQRTLTWRVTRGLSKPLVAQMLNKLKHSVRTRHKVNQRFAYNLRKIENNENVAYFKNFNSPWFSI